VSSCLAAACQKLIILRSHVLLSTSRSFVEIPTAMHLSAGLFYRPLLSTMYCMSNSVVSCVLASYRILFPMIFPGPFTAFAGSVVATLAWHVVASLCLLIGHQPLL
jgi:hypothetical protein